MDMKKKKRIALQCLQENVSQQKQIVMIILILIYYDFSQKSISLKQSHLGCLIIQQTFFFVELGKMNPINLNLTWEKTNLKLSVKEAKPILHSKRKFFTREYLRFLAQVAFYPDNSF